MEKPDDRSIDTHVSNVRRKLGIPGPSGLQIRNIRGKGDVLAEDGARE